MIEPWRVQEVQDWNRYRVVVLADVADLPGPVAAKIADFVFHGGGLLIAPGQQASPAFYNGWSVTHGDERMRLVPATLKTRVADLPSKGKGTVPGKWGQFPSCRLAARLFDARPSGPCATHGDEADRPGYGRDQQLLAA